MERIIKFILYILRLDDVVLNYYYRAYPKPINPIYYLRKIKNWDNNYKLSKHIELVQLIKNMRAQSSSTGCSFGDYFTLYNEIKKRQPISVLELGSGISSAVISFALKEQYEITGIKAKFISMEEDAFYHSEIVRIFPKDLLEYTDLRLSKISEHTKGNLVGLYYSDIPNSNFDFIFIDGPSVVGKDPRVYFDYDLVQLIKNKNIDSNFLAILDNRIHTLRILKRMLPQNRFNYQLLDSITKIYAG